MKNKDLGNLRNKTVIELSALARETRNQIVRAGMDLSLHKVKNTNSVKGLRRTLAQVLTVKKEKELLNK